MTFIIVVLMSALSVTGETQLYFLYEPTFKNFEECRTFVANNHNGIYKQAIAEYDFSTPAKEIYCVEKEKLEMNLKNQGKQQV